MQAPQNLICTGESQEITLSYAGSNVEKVMGSVTFKNDRQKASVSVYKQDKKPGNTFRAALMACMPETTSKQRTEPLWSKRYPH